jgi:hypothetical protein
VAIELIESEIRRFLSSTEPEVICIRGRWGVGKTFAWNRYLGEARAAHQIGLKRYAYLSLFGLTSLEELKFSIFENSVPSDKEAEPNLETLKSNAIGVADHLGRKAVWFAQQLPWVKNHIGGLGPVWFLSVKNTIICVDDFERRGDRLAVRDVLGLVSNLKEHKGCKVVLILNDEALEADKPEFEKYLEKVVDASLKFAPSPTDCARIALSATTETSVLLKESCVALGISNIRVIKRIERAIRQIQPLLKEFDRNVMTQAVQSLTLLGWSVLEPKLAPPLDYLEKSRGADLFGVSKPETVPENEAAWNALLDAYHWQTMDDFDRVLRDGIQNGCFDPALVKTRASELDAKITASKSNASFEDAWSAFHDSFADNQEAVLDAIYQAFVQTIQYRTPLDLNGTVWLFKKLGRRTQAADLIRQFVATRGDKRKLFDLDRFPFRDRIDEPDVIRAFNEKCATLKDETSPAETLLSIARTRGWNEDDITMLSTLPVDEYFKILRGSEDQILMDTLDACLQFDRIANATIPMKEISKRAKQALKRIGQESAINALRVKKYGVDANAADANDGSTPSAAS